MTVLLLLLLLACCCSGCAAFYLPDSEKKETRFGATLSPILYIYNLCVKFHFGLPQLALARVFFLHFFHTLSEYTHTHTQITWFRSFEFAFSVPDRVSFVYTFSAYISQCGGLNSICAFDSFVCVCVCACVNSVALGISSSDSCSKYFFSLKS